MVYGLGKSRTRLGRYIDANGIKQGKLEIESGISETTITKLCNDVGYQPNEKTKAKIVSALQELGYDVCISDLW